MHNNLKHMSCNLADFGNHILSAAIECNKAVQAPDKYMITGLIVLILILTLILVTILLLQSLKRKY